MSEADDDILYEGLHAFQLGKDPSSCPYSPVSAERCLWLAGWDEARRKRRRKLAHASPATEPALLEEESEIISCVAVELTMAHEYGARDLAPETVHPMREGGVADVGRAGVRPFDR